MGGRHMNGTVFHPLDTVIQPVEGLGLEIEEVGGSVLHFGEDCLTTQGTFACGSCPWSTFSCFTSFGTIWSTGS